MSKSTLPWFRFYTETISDTKFDVISNRIRQPKIVLIGAWSILLSLASKSPERGSLLITSTIPYTIEDLASICEISIDDMTDILNELESMEMLEIYEDCYFIKNWNKRQFESDSSTDRVKDHRKRYSNVTVTPPDTDTDTDTDTDLLIKKEEGEKSSKNPEINIFKAYEQEIGPLTPMIADELKLLEKEHPPNWIVEALKISALNSKRNLAYSKAILQRWKAEGYGTDPPGYKHGGNGNKPVETPAQRLVREERDRLAKGLSP